MMTENPAYVYLGTLEVELTTDKYSVVLRRS